MLQPTSQELRTFKGFLEGLDRRQHPPEACLEVERLHRTITTHQKALTTPLVLLLFISQRCHTRLLPLEAATQSHRAMLAIHRRTLLSRPPTLGMVPLHTTHLPSPARLLPSLVRHLLRLSQGLTTTRRSLADQPRRLFSHLQRQGSLAVLEDMMLGMEVPLLLMVAHQVSPVQRRRSLVLLLDSPGLTHTDKGSMVTAIMVIMDNGEDTDLKKGMERMDSMYTNCSTINLLTVKR